MALRLSLANGGGARTLTSGTLSIGRGERNDWVLPDPARHLSKTHCVISVEDGRYVLTDLSTNGVHINGARQPTARDSRVMLTDGDEFSLGDHSILVEEVAAAADPRGPARESDPLDIDPLDDPLGIPPDRSAGGLDPAGFSHPVRHAPPTRRIDDPFDRLDKAPGRPANRDDDLFSGLSPATSWEGPAQPDHVDAPRHAMPVPRVIAPVNPNEIDFDALIGDLSSLDPHPAQPPAPSPPPREVVPRAPADPFAELDDPPAPPRLAAASRPPAPAAGAPPSEAMRAALMAFLEGAGVPDATIPADPETALRGIGAVFAMMAEGLREVLLSRAAIKSEMRVEQTMIRATNNNALKFSLTPRDAVIALLSVGRQGYMPPLAAAREAFDDIKMHELAVIAGVQTALADVLRRFDPDAIEKRLVQSKLASVLPSARKARLWDSFREIQRTIAAEAEDDIQAVFGRSFAKAYRAKARDE